MTPVFQKPTNFEVPRSRIDLVPVKVFEPGPKKVGLELERKKNWLCDRFKFFSGLVHQLPDNKEKQKINIRAQIIFFANGNVLHIFGTALRALLTVLALCFDRWKIIWLLTT